VVGSFFAAPIAPLCAAAIQIVRRENQWLTHSPNSNRLCWRLSAMISE